MGGRRVLRFAICVAKIVFIAETYILLDKSDILEYRYTSSKLATTFAKFAKTSS